MPGAFHPTTEWRSPVMLAVHPRIVDVMWAAIAPRLPVVVDEHPLGCHRRRLADRDCFEAILFGLVAGCSWDVAGRLGKGSETTLRRRRSEWLEAGVFDGLVDESLAGYDRIIGLDLSEVAVDGSHHKAPFGGEGTGPNPVGRGKCGWKWSMATDRAGISIGWEIAGANRNDCVLLDPTLDAVDGRGLLAEIDTLHLDRGYDHTVVRRLVANLGFDDWSAPGAGHGTANGTRPFLWACAGPWSHAGDRRSHPRSRPAENGVTSPGSSSVWRRH